MYYFNTKTGQSQWEPPDDFPIPKLESHGKVTRTKQQQKESIIQKDEEEPVAVMFKAVLGFAVTVAGKATEAIVDHVVQQKKEPSKKPWWSNLFQSKEETPKSNTEVIDLLSEIHHSLPQQQDDHRNHNHVTTNTARKQHAFWATSWKSSTSEPTRPVIPPSHREQKIQEKLYADSLKRQDNLRKNYRQVIENRSPTISLSALKRDGHHNEWLQFLNE